MAYKYDGFWASMDTFKDKQLLDDMYARGDSAWEVWKRTPGATDRRTAEPIGAAEGPAVIGTAGRGTA